jgi:hypothetical protein
LTAPNRFDKVGDRERTLPSAAAAPIASSIRKVPSTTEYSVCVRR